MIELYCQHCGQRMEIADQYSGQTGKCKSCGKQVLVPAAEPVSAIKQVPQAQIAPVPYKWFGAVAGLAAFLAVGAYILFKPDAPAPQQSVADDDSASTRNQAASGRTLTFPINRTVGVVILTNEGTWGWNGKHLQEVRGDFDVPPGKDLGLWVRKEDSADLSFLKDFLPDDLDFLYLHHPEMTDNQLQNVTHLTGLKALSIEFCDIGDSGIRVLSSLAQLTDFGLVGSDISDTAIGTLLGFTHLEGVHIAGTRVTERGASRLKSLPSLRNITLGTSMMTPPMVDALKEFPALRGLYLNTLGQNEGENFPLPPETIPLLKELTQIEELMFWGPPIDDSLVSALSQMPSLKKITFSRDTSLTLAGLNELKRALPNCKIVP